MVHKRASASGTTATQTYAAWWGQCGFTTIFRTLGAAEIACNAPSGYPANYGPPTFCAWIEASLTHCYETYYFPEYLALIGARGS
ncbi:hypothetical protein ACFONN_02160 [Dyella humi]|uniref:Tannase/feruloyl esterase family alpha/beta hydrolase n=1 Tax=Dyella humi TaxID=1770547 RepID=A0ABW8ICY1_9GAMM